MTRPRTFDWSAAVTLSDLGDLTARYLSGEADESPTYLGPPDPETAEILEPLLALNRSGLVTDQSQPGLIEDGWRQRAFVEGYCTPQIADQLAAACRTAGLGIIVVPPSDRPRWRTGYARAIYVSDDGVGCTVVGAIPSTRELRWLWGGHLSRTGLDAILDAHRVAIHDPQWGRRDVLWHALTESISSTHRGPR